MPDQPPTPPFRIDAVPALRVVTPGAKVTYRVVKNRPDAEDPTQLACQWWVINDPQTTTIFRASRMYGPWQTVWKDATWDFEGRHRVVCHLTASGEDYVYEQNVAKLDSVLALGPSIPFQKDDPEVVLDAVSRKLDLVVAWGNKVAPANDDVANRHKDQVAQLTDFRDHLKTRLESTKGETRYVVWAEHLDEVSQRRTPLKVFLAKSSSGDWTLVDWTNPTVQRMSGEYTGTGASTAEAVKAAFKAWDDANRYPDGGISYRVEGLPDAPTIQSSFDTDGTSFWDSVSHFFAYVGLALAVTAAVVTLVAPVPGSQVVSGLLWAAIFSGTVSASLNIGQRHIEGYPDARADAFDVLTIIANCFAAGALWIRGASVITPQIARAVLIGQVTADGAQGVLLSADSVDEINKISNDDTLTPSEKTEKISQILRSLVIAGTLIVVNVKGTKADLENLNTVSKRFPQEPTPQQRLDQLKAADATVDLTQPAPKPEGHTADGTHTTTAHVDQEEQTPHAGGRTNEAHTRTPEQRFRDGIGNAHYDELKAEVPQLRAQHPEVAALTDDEIIAIRGYVGDTPKPEFAGLKDYQRINRALISEDQQQLAILKEYIDTLTSGLKKMPQYAGRVGRMIPSDVSDADIVAQFKPGAEWTNKNFMSTAEGSSLDRSWAMMSFSGTKSGHKVTALQMFGEREVLFPPGSKFRVLNVMELPPGSPTKFIIMLEEL